MKISRNTITIWIRTIINITYRMATEENCTAIKVKVHKVCSVDPSPLFKDNFTVNQVMWAGTWMSQMSFTAFYPICHSQVHGQILFSIGPVVAIEHVI